MQSEADARQFAAAAQQWAGAAAAAKLRPTRMIVADIDRLNCPLFAIVPAALRAPSPSVRPVPPLVLMPTSAAHVRLRMRVLAVCDLAQLRGRAAQYVTSSDRLA